MALGFKTLADYVKFDSLRNSPTTAVNFGETVGRYANRIANGKFTLNQPGQGAVTYTLPVNNGPNALHGGIVGFGNHIWAAQTVTGYGSVGVQLTLNSPNGDEGAAAGFPGCPNGCTGYPAAIKVVLTYTLNNANQLVLHYTTTNESKNLNTILNLTNHSYFNLAGESPFPGSAYSQLIQINANKTRRPTLPRSRSATWRPCSTRRRLHLHPFAMGARIQDVSVPDPYSPGFNQLLEAQGYDHNWVLNKQTSATTGPPGPHLARHRCLTPAAGWTPTVWTDQPGVQLDTSNFLTGTLGGISGHAYRQGAAYTFETQHLPCTRPTSPTSPFHRAEGGPTPSVLVYLIFAFFY